jgi:heme o synthase
MSRAKTASKDRLRAYYQLSKPGIVYGNLISAVAGYLLASAFNITWSVLLGLVVGMGLVIAAACTSNNYMDQRIDVVMQRTRKRPLITGLLTGRQALTYGVLAFCIGLLILLCTQNTLTNVLIVIAFIDYVFLYGYSKRASVHGTLVGTISGSLPLVAGYTAVTNSLDGGALLLFLLMATWQMAHFYGIALYRLADYKAAHIPVMPAVRGVETTIWQVLAYIGLFVVSGLLLLMFGYVGVVPGILLLVLGIVWLWRAAAARQRLEAVAWGQQVFLFSLIVMVGMSAVLAVGRLLP